MFRFSVFTYGAVPDGEPERALGRLAVGERAQRVNVSRLLQMLRVPLRVLRRSRTHVRPCDFATDLCDVFAVLADDQP